MLPKIKLALFTLISCLTTQLSYAQLDMSVWDHVYNIHRLQLIDSNITVTGTVTEVRGEHDGDYHILLKLDTVNDVHTEDNMLILEVICAKSVTQDNAVNFCKGYVNKITIPPINDHVQVNGSYVFDRHHKCYEIHPVHSITKTQ